MHRTQINILDAAGQVIGQPITSISEDEVLIPIGDQHFAIIACNACDSDGYIETEPVAASFVPHYYDFDDLAKAFDADQMAEFVAAKAAKDAERAEELRKLEYEKYLQLKSKFDPK